MLDFDLGLNEVPLSFPVRFPTSGSISDDVSNSELRNFDFQDQMERTINPLSEQKLSHSQVCLWNKLCELDLLQQEWAVSYCVSI